MTLINRLRRNEKGQSMVELALVLPVVVMLLFGILEFGRVFHCYLVITNAAREGTRIGVVGRPDSEITARVFDSAPLSDTASNLHITRIEPAEGARTTGLPLLVEVSYDLYLVTPLFSGILPNPYTLTSSATMRME